MSLFHFPSIEVNFKNFQITRLDILNLDIQTFSEKKMLIRSLHPKGAERRSVICARIPQLHQTQFSDSAITTCLVLGQQDNFSNSVLCKAWDEKDSNLFWSPKL